MLYRSSIAAIALAALSMTLVGAQAFDESKYPDWSGQWSRVPDGGPPRYDPTKPIRKQEAPIKPEYQLRYEASLKDIDAGGFGLDRHYACVPMGMPRAMSGVSLMEFVFSPNATHILFEEQTIAPRRIYTDGRDWPKNQGPTYGGYSIGKWLDTAGSGRYDLLEVETRGLRGPRTYDETGIPFHEDNETVIKERIYLDKADRNILVDEITVFDHALTRPWALTKKYVRKPEKQPLWLEAVCAENNPHIVIADQPYMLSADGKLMPAKKDQAPPDLRYFKQSPK
jgi:hypothetical protein